VICIDAYRAIDAVEPICTIALSTDEAVKARPADASRRAPNVIVRFGKTQGLGCQSPGLQRPQGRGAVVS